MIDTNLLLAVAFSMVTNFTSVVPVPESDIPKSPQDLRIYRLGTVNSPVDAMVAGPTGAPYWLMGGVVQYFNSPQNYFREQSPERIGNYAGSPTLTSNQVVQVASDTLKRLAKSSSMPNLAPRVAQAGVYKGKRVPFYRVEWPPVTRQGGTVGAEIDVDARSGKIVLVHLLDVAFLDPAAARRIRDQVYTADSSPKRNSWPVAPRPTPDQVSRAITNWLMLCARLQIPTEPNVGLSDVNWNETSLARLMPYSSAGPACFVRFTNGVGFLSLDGTVILHTSGRMQDRKGRVVNNWRDLSKKLERTLVERLAFRPEELAPFSPEPEAVPPAVGTEGTRALWVKWRETPLSRNYLPTSERKPGFAAEFDLETGQMRSIKFDDPSLIGALRRAHSERR